MENKAGYVKRPTNFHNETIVDELNSFLESLHEHDDRSMVLNIAAFAEDTLGDLLCIYLREEKQAKELIAGFNAPLGTFSSRIKAAYVMGLIPRDVYETLDILRKVRNNFAHNWKGVSFDRADIVGLINKLSLSRAEEFGSETRIEEKVGISLRHRFRNKTIDVLIDMRMLAKNLKKSGKKIPVISWNLNPIRCEFVVVESFDDENGEFKNEVQHP